MLIFKIFFEYEKKVFLGFIPARKGSQGIKNKNLILLKKKKTC